MSVNGAGVNELIGQRFDRLTVIGVSGEKPKRPSCQRIICRCDCGADKVVRLDHLQSGNTRSCGCLRIEVFAQHLARRRAAFPALPGMKICRKCKQEKPVVDFKFFSGAHDGLSSWCRECHRVERWLREFGITPARYAEMAVNGCNICGSMTSGSGKEVFPIDHDRSCCPGDRSCGKCVRGVLCSPCNTSLGGFRDNPTLLYNAITYLEAWRERNAASRMDPNALA